MSALTFLVNHAEWTVPLCALISYGCWRLLRVRPLVTEEALLQAARNATPDRWAA